MKELMEKAKSIALTFFGVALLCYFGAKLLMRVWCVLVIIAVIAIVIILCIRFGKKPKY